MVSLLTIAVIYVSWKCLILIFLTEIKIKYFKIAAYLRNVSVKIVTTTLDKFQRVVQRLEQIIV